MMDRLQVERWLGFPFSHGQGQNNVTSVVIDSRQVKEGSLFVPLIGERTDGHNYIEKALKRGAVVIPVLKTWADNQSELLHRWQEKAFFPVVDDTLLALQDLAKGYLAQFDNLTVIGITGSNGKTTTKEITQAILSRSGASICNEGNFNSDSGLPLSVFRIKEEHRYAILEMGMNRIGEMASLARVARPDFALVTNVGTAHIGMIGSQQGIAEEKKAIFSLFDGKQTAFLNNDDPFTEFLSQKLKGRVVKYGTGVTEGYEFVREEGIFGQVIRLCGRDIHFPLPGHFNVINALGAVSIARELGFSEEDIALGLESCRGQFGRSEVVQGKTVTLFRDCYNANGDSMDASLSLFDQTEKSRRKVVVLGDMGELGEETASTHTRVLKKALDCSFDGIFLLGENFINAMKKIEEKKKNAIRAFDNYEQLESALLDYVNREDLVLLKGSRLMALERLSEPLLAL